MGKLAGKRKAEWDLMMKNLICDATVLVVNEHGFNGLRMDLVAKAAEVATGTLYNYFKDKNELLLHVINTKFEPINNEFLKIRNSHASPAKKLEKVFCVFLDSIEEHKNFTLVVAGAQWLSLPIKKGAKAKREIIIKIASEIIDEGIEQGVFRKVDTLLAASLIFGAMERVAQERIEGVHISRSVEEEVADCMSFVFSGLIMRNPKQ